MGIYVPRLVAEYLSDVTYEAGLFDTKEQKWITTEGYSDTCTNTTESGCLFEETYDGILDVFIEDVKFDIEKQQMLEKQKYLDFLLNFKNNPDYCIEHLEVKIIFLGER